MIFIAIVFTAAMTVVAASAGRSMREKQLDVMFPTLKDYRPGALTVTPPTESEIALDAAFGRN